MLVHYLRGDLVQQWDGGVQLVVDQRVNYIRLAAPLLGTVVISSEFFGANSSQLYCNSRGGVTVMLGSASLLGYRM